MGEATRYFRDIAKVAQKTLRQGLQQARRVNRRAMGGVVRSIDLRKPIHAVLIGVILAGIAAPIASWLVTNERYRLTQPMALVVERPSPTLMSKLRYDKEKKANIFNAEGEVDADNPKDKLQMSLGAGGKKDKQLYTATMPDDPAQGIDIRDNVNDVSVKFVPQFAVMGGRGKDGRVSYPLKDQSGQMIFTPKANGVKEDILLNAAPKEDAQEYRYSLDMPASVESRLEQDGSIGFYTGTPELFGDISYGTNNDRELVEKARVNSAKNYLMFKIPAPVIKETGEGSAVMARFVLEGKTLVVRASGLLKANYPVSIDPTFLISSTAEFVLGSVDDNIDLSVANQVGRKALVGGSTPGWTATAADNMPYGQFAASLVAYNGFMYIIGGGCDDTNCNSLATRTTNNVYYIDLNTTTGALGTGTPGNWTATSTLNFVRQGLVAFGFNGYLYAIGGEDDNEDPVAAGNSVEYAKINANGSVGAWANTGDLNVARSYPAGAIYQGVLYVMGGSSGNLNGSLRSDSEYARINGDGTITSWTTTSSFTTARNRFRGEAYNGFVYVAGGRSGTPAVLNDVQYAAIDSDGSLGAWATTTAFPSARRDHGMAINNGYIYIFSGSDQGAMDDDTFIVDTQYAQIQADGTLGQWQRTLHNNSGFNDGVGDYNDRMPAGSTAYSNHVYFIGGCNNEDVSTTNDCTGRLVGTFISDIDPVGRFDRGIQTIQTTPPYNNNASTLARMGGQSVALNGYMYYIGGCSVASCNTAISYKSTVEYAAINANGTLGTFATTSALISTSGGANNAGRIGHAVVAYDNKVYVIGGVERTTGNADSYRSDTISATQNTNGTLNTFAAETNTLPVARAFGAAVIWHDRIFYTGGLLNATTLATAATSVYRSQITGNAPAAWAVTTNRLTNIRWGHSIGLWGNWLYVIGGQSNTTGTYVTAATGVEQLTITNGGDITTASSVQNPTGQPLVRLAGGLVHNGVLYIFGGYRNGSTNASAVINYSALNATTGALGAWSVNIANYEGQTQGLATARGATTAVATGGNFYVMGGCTATMATTTFSSCATFVTTANTTEHNLPNNGGTGQSGSFSTVTALSAARADHSAVAYNGKLYLFGGCTAYTSGSCNSAALTTAQSADINEDGTLSASWTTQTALPTGRSLQQAAAYNGFMYVVGGQSNGSTETATVWYTSISNTGVLGAWTDDTNDPLPVARRAFGMAISNGYIYVAGGRGSGGRLNDVYYAPLDVATGDVGTWTSSGNVFTTTRSNHTLIAYNGALYIIGGYDGTNALRDIQYAIIDNTNGSVGTWAYATDVDRAMNVSQAVAANGYMYFIGNEGSRTEVMYANINANGTLGAIQRSGNVMAGAHAHGAAAWFDGSFFITGACAVAANGDCNASPTTTNEKAGQQATSRTGHYSKLFDTQVDTSPTQLVINGAVNGPGAVVEFKFQTASQSDPVLGVAQLIRPVVFGNFYTVQALNSSGTNVGVAFNYLYVIALDDSRSGTFPDVPNTASGFAQTAVTDVTLYYHANPSRRLRHGASYTNTGCNPTPAEGCILDTAP